MDFAWMAWTWQTALFFAVIGSLLLIMTALAILRPETRARRHPAHSDNARRPAVHFAARRAFIHLAWLGLVGPDLVVGSRRSRLSMPLRVPLRVERDQSPFGMRAEGKRPIKIALDLNRRKT